MRLVIVHIDAFVVGRREPVGFAQSGVDLLLAQPLLSRGEVPGEDGENGDRAEDDTGKVEGLGIDGEIERRDHDLHIRAIISSGPTVRCSREEDELTAKTSPLNNVVAK